MCFRKVGAVGFEPTTFCVSDRYSNQLSYTPVHIKNEEQNILQCTTPCKTKKVFNPILIVSVNDCVLINGSHFKLRSTFMCTNGIIAVSRIELESDDNESSELPLLPHRANRKEWGTTIFAPHQYEKIYLNGIYPRSYYSSR